MKKIISIILLAFAICTSQAQTIKKEASNTNPYIGQEFFYTIRVDDLTDLSDLDFIEDSFGPELDYVGVEYDNIMQYFLNFNATNGLGCVSYSDSASTQHYFRLDFNNCNGNVVGGFDSFSFKVKVRLNESACGLQSTYDNKAQLSLNSSPNEPIISNKESITVNKSEPFVLQKTFRSAANGELIYDIRLSSESGNFYPLDFGSTPKFYDTFTLPNCLTIAANDVSVVLITDESTTPMTEDTSIAYNTNVSGNVVNLNWNLQGATKNNTSILYQVKFKINDCSACGNALFQLQNEAFFKAHDRCGKQIKKDKEFNIDNVTCINKIEVPAPITCKIDLKKEVELDGNDLNLTMKGCTGKYKITITNCSKRIWWKNFTLKDIIPNELNINGPITINGNATHTLVNQFLEVIASATLNPNDIVEIIIPFEVTTSNPNIGIDNCAAISLYGYDNFNIVYNLTEQACAPTIVTVPNEVAVVANKILCSDSKSECGPFKNSDNLPGDIVEYALQFYNYGTVEATNVKVEDVLPPHFKIQNINTDVRVYVINRESVSTQCDMSDAKDITGDVAKNYSTATNLLEIKMNGRDLYEFTCKGIFQYVVKVKAKIDLDAPNGVYDNVFTVNFKDPNNQNNNTAVSNKVTNIVNVNNLVLGSKTFEEFAVDCESKTKKVTYQIAIANMGTFPVYVDINDVLTVPSPANVVSIGNFQLKVNSGSFVPYPISNANASGFSINAMQLLPCESKVLTYDVIYNTNLLTGNQSVQACNNATAKVYTKNKKKIIPIITANASLMQNYFKSVTDADKLLAIDLIKSYKKSTKKKAANRFEFDETILGEKCVTLNDCLKGSGSACFTDNSSSFDFQITSMNRNGEISTTLNNNSGQKITQIEYLLSDIRLIDPCEDGVSTIGNIPFIFSCFGCSENLTGAFSTTDISSIGSLSHANQSLTSGKYTENNKVTFKGLPTSITQDNRTFNFPVNANCNGTFEFTITAIVHFEDCSVCYVTDAFDYNASFRPIFRPIGGTYGPPLRL